MLEIHSFPAEIRYSPGHTVVSRTPLQERVRRRFKALVDAKGVPHKTIGAYLGLTRSAVTRLLNDDDSSIALQHIERLCEFFQITPSEVMVEPGALIQPIAPDEAQLLTHFRQLTYTQRQGLLAVLEGRLAQPTKPRRARFGSVALTEEQQMLVDLYVQSEPQAREGVLKILKGTARHAARPAPTDGAHKPK